MSQTLKTTPRVKHLWREVKRILRRHPAVTADALSGVALQKLVGKTDPVILEIGCHHGDHTLWFLDLFPESRIYCFEPDQRPQAVFRDRICDPRVELFEFAISDADGEAEFHRSGGVPNDCEPSALPHGWDASSSLRKPKKHLKYSPWCEFNQVVKVETKRLDTWRAGRDLPQIDFIWADTQGAEVNLIRGGQQTLARTRYFYTEYNNREMYEGQMNLRGLLKLLPNFEVVDIYPNDVLLRNRELA